MNLPARAVDTESPSGALLDPRFRGSNGARPRRTVVGGRRDALDLLQAFVIGAILTYVWRIHDVFSILGPLQLTMIASLGSIGMYVIDRDPRRALGTVAHPVMKMMGLILVLAVISTPFSIHDGRSFRFITGDLWKSLAIALVLAASVRSMADVRRYVVLFVSGAVAYALFVFLNVAVGAGGRLADLVYHDANDFGMLLVCSLPLALYLALRGRRLWLRIGAAAAILLFLVMIVRTGSRGAFLGVITVAVYLLFAFDSVSRRVRTAAITLGAIAILALGSAQYWDTMRTLLNPKDDYNWAGQSETGRLNVWKRGIGYMIKRPITGLGIDAFVVAEGTMSPLAERAVIGRGVKWSAAHNSFIQVGAELGIPGLIVFTLMLYHAYRAARRIGRQQSGAGNRLSDEAVLGQALAASVIGFLVTGFFLSQAYGAFTYILCGLIVGLVKASRPNHPGVRRRRSAMSFSPQGMQRAAGPAA